MKEPGLADIRSGINEIRRANPGMSIDDAFVLWFLTAYLTDSTDEARKALVGGAGEKDSDAILVDHRNRIINVVQGKFRQDLDKSENRQSVVSLARVAALPWNKEKWDAYQSRLDPFVLKRLSEAITYIRKREYRLSLYFVTTGRCSTGICEEAEQLALDDSEGHESSVDFRVVQGGQLLSVYKDYLDGVAPAIGLMRLPILHDGSGSSGLLRRHDPASGIESWIFSMASRDVGGLYDRAGIRLFARNIRGFLGDSDINKAMSATVKEDPENFWYYNNGVTIVCDGAKRIEEGGKDVLLVQQPQVINGQQTTRTLAKFSSRNAEVLVKVIKIPRVRGDFQRYDGLVSSIVRATNWQNPIKPGDLVSNDYIQVFLDREFRKVGYHYLRKRQSKREARAAIGDASLIQIKKEELAQAVIACDADPAVVLGGVQALFEDPQYTRTFSSQNLSFYLSRYWLMRIVRGVAYGRPERSYPKWHVLSMTWDLVGHELSSAAMERTFRVACESRDFSITRHANAMAETLFQATLAYYRRNRGSGDAMKDRQSFFKQSGLYGPMNSFATKHGYIKRARTHAERLIKSLRQAAQGH